MTEPIANEPELSSKYESSVPKPKLVVESPPPVEQPQDKKAEEVVELNRLKEEIKTEAATVESVTEKYLGTTKPQPDNRQNKKTNPIRNFINWLKYPSANDNYKINRNVFMPASVAAVASSLGVYFATLPQFATFAAMHQMSVENFIFGSVGLLIPSGITMATAVAMKERANIIEEKNRISFSKLLTVSKVFTSERSTLRPTFEKIDSDFKSGFTGELHFVGIDETSWEGITNPLSTLKEGLIGLQNLAIACEQNDPRLQDLDLFGGKSRSINPTLEKYGFKTFPLGEIVKPSIMDKIMSFVAEFRARDTTYPNGYKPHGESYIGVISRKDLILHKNDFSKEVERIKVLEEKRLQKV